MATKMTKITRAAAALLAGILLLASFAFAEEPPMTIQAMTGLGQVQEKLDQGAVIEKVYFTNGYGFSSSEFTTADPDEIAMLWAAVNAIRVVGKTDGSITDWYPHIVFYLDDGTSGGAAFEAGWLTAGRYNYDIAGAEGFWNLTAFLMERHRILDKGGKPESAAVAPLPVDRGSLDLSNGSFSVQVENMDRIAQDNALSLSLYLEDRYSPDAIRRLAPGDMILVAGSVYTVVDIDARTVGWFGEPEYLVCDISTAEENWEGIRFVETSAGTFAVSVGDWAPVTYVGSVTIPLPLPESFVYYDYPGGQEPEARTARDLLDDLRTSSPSFFSPYNTTAVLENGELTELHSWSYPWGPETDDQPD